MQKTIAEILAEDPNAIPPELEGPFDWPVQVVANVVGSTPFDYRAGPIHIYGSYEIMPPDLVVTVDVTVFGQTVTIGQINGTSGCVGKDFGFAKIQACLSIKPTGIWLTADVLSFHYDKQIISWSKAVTALPQVAGVVTSTAQPAVAGRAYLDVTLRDPSTLDHTGLHLARATIEKGTVVPEHMHQSDIIHVCTQGHLEWQVTDGPTLTTKQGDVIQMPALTRYSVRAVETSQTVAGCVIVYW